MIEMSVADLMNQIEESDDSFFIENVIPTGITLLVGKPKVGKSLLALQFSDAIASGNEIFNSKTNKSSVFYISTELKNSDMKERIIKSNIAKNYINSNNVLKIAKREDDLNFISLDNCLLENNKKKYDFVVIDILEKFIKEDGINDYKAIYSLINKFSDYYMNYDISFLLVHHLNKKEKTLGSTGFDAACDTCITLLNDKEKNDCKLKIITRKCADQIYNLEFNSDNLTFKLKEIEKEEKTIDMAIALIIKYVILNKKFIGNLQELAVQSNVISLNLNPISLGKLLRDNIILLKQNGITFTKKKSNTMIYEIFYNPKTISSLGEWESTFTHEGD